MKSLEEIVLARVNDFAQEQDIYLSKPELEKLAERVMESAVNLIVSNVSTSELEDLQRESHARISQS